MERNPTQLSKQQAKDLTTAAVLLRGKPAAPHSLIKRPDCAFYTSCLTEARNGDWKGFSCGECSAFEVLDAEQQVQDIIAIMAALEAAKNEEEQGCAGRKRGVRPGADAKVRRRLTVVQEIEDEPIKLAVQVKKTLCL